MLPIVQEESSRFDFLNPRCACCIQKERGRIIVLLLAAVNVRDCYKDALLWAEGVPAWELARPTHSVLQGATGAMLGCTVLRYIHSLDRDHTAYYKNPGGAWLCWETTNTADGPTGPALEERSIQTQRWAALSEVANMRWIWCQSDSQGLRPKANHNQNGFLMIPDDSWWFLSNNRNLLEMFLCLASDTGFFLTSHRHHQKLPGIHHIEATNQLASYKSGGQNNAKQLQEHIQTNAALHHEKSVQQVLILA